MKECKAADENFHGYIKALRHPTNRYLKSWLGMPYGGSFLPLHSGVGMDVKSVSHVHKESRSLDIVRALIHGITLFKLLELVRYVTMVTAKHSTFYSLRLAIPHLELQTLRQLKFCGDTKSLNVYK
jgi:hypothetical protein